MRAKIGEILAQYATQDNTLMEQMEGFLSSPDSSIIEVTGESGSGKSYLLNNLISHLNSVNKKYTLYTPKVFKHNQLADIINLITELPHEEFRAIVKEAEGLKIKHKFDFFYYISDQISKRKMFTSKTIIIDNCFNLDKYTIDFVQYLSQYLDKVKIKFVVFTREITFSFSNLIKIKGVNNSEINSIFQKFFDFNEDEFHTQSELIYKLSDGNLSVIRHFIELQQQQDEKLELGAYLGKKMDERAIYNEKLANLDADLLELFFMIMFLEGNTSKAMLLKYLTAPKLELKLKNLLSEGLVYLIEEAHYVSKSTLALDYFCSFSTTKKKAIFDKFTKTFEVNINHYLKLDILKDKLNNDAIEYLSSINDYDSLLELYKILIKKSKDASKKMNLLINLGIACKRLNYKEKATEYFREALKVGVEATIPVEKVVLLLAQNLYSENSSAFALELIKRYSPSTIDKKLYCQILLLKGEILMDQEKFDEALMALDEISQATDGITDKDLRLEIKADYRKIRGKIFFYSNEWGKAEDEFYDAEKLYSSINSISGLAATYNNLGVLTMHQCQWKETEKYFLKSLELEKQRYNLNGLSVCYSNLGSLLEDEGFFEKAIEHLNDALKIQKLLGDSYKITTFYFNIGVIYMHRGKYDEAADAFNNSLNIAIKFNLYRNVDAALNGLGALYFKSGDWAKAIDYYERALAKSKEKNFIEGLCQSYNNLGELYERRGESILAYDYYSKSLELLPDTSDDYLKAELYGNLGSVLSTLHRFGEAYKYLVESYDFFKSLNSIEKILEGSLKQAMYFYYTRNFESANYYLEFALEKAEEFNDDFQMGRCYYIKGLILKTNDIDAAIKSFKKAIELYVNSQNNFELGLTYYEYAELLLEKQDWEQALQILQSNTKIIEKFGAINFLEKNDILIQKIRTNYASELEESKQQESLLNKFYEITQHLNSIENYDVLLETALDKLVEFASADGGLFCLYKNPQVKDSWEYVTQHNINVNDPLYPSLLQLITDTFEDNENKNIKQPHFAPALNNIVAFPLTVRNDKKGVICMFSRYGSNYFSEKMFNLISALCNQVIVIVENISFSNLEKSHAVIRQELAESSTYSNIIGKSEKLQKIFSIIDKIKDTPTTVLLEGLSGTGKELIARAIHYRSDRRNKKFVAQYCGALPETLLESELFGHVKGSFTGASHDKKGLFEIADGGTFFLDEIGDISLSTQAKLLRFLQEGEIKKVGSTRTDKVDVRVICATNIPLREKVEKGEFRLDLYYRLNVIRIDVPSLCERRTDIPLLAVHFLDKYTKKITKKVNGITDEAMKYLINYDWPGNIRQLENEIERAVTLADEDSFIKPNDLSKEIFTYQQNTETISLLENRTMKDAVEKLEREMIQRSLESSNWNQTRSAKELGLSRQGLIKKMQRYQIEKP